MAEQAPVATPTEAPSSTPSGDSGRTSEAPSRREQARSTRGTDSLSKATTAAATAKPPRADAGGAGDKIGGGAVVAGDAPQPETPWQAPAYAVGKWKQNQLDALKALSTNPDLKDHWSNLDGALNEWNGIFGRQSHELGQARKLFGPVQDMLMQASQQYQLQGMSLEQGLGQQMAVARSLMQNPDATLQQLGVWYKPQNPAETLKGLAQHWGLDLGQLAQAAPYVDPVVARQLAETRAQLQQIQDQNWRQQQAGQQQVYNQLVNHITAFEQAKDASGNLKYPFAAEVGAKMGSLLKYGDANSLEEAYEKATEFHPKAMESRRKAAEQKAREDAARNTADAEVATNAARNVNSRASGRATQARTMNEAIAQAHKSTYGKTT